MPNPTGGGCNLCVAASFCSTLETFSSRAGPNHATCHLRRWRLVVGDWWLMAIGSGWWLAVGCRRQLMEAGAWRLVVVGGWWRLVVGG